MPSRSPAAIRPLYVCLVLLLASAVSQVASTMMAPSVTATLTDSFAPGGDVDGDGKADPGDKVRYTATIAVSGEAATDVNFSATIDPHTTLVGGSLQISPLAVGDTYQSVGNMTLTSGDIAADCAANPSRSVLCNDIGTNLSLIGFGATEGAASGTAVDGLNAVTTANGGTVVLSADGTFVYDPAAGFEGTDTFWYAITNIAGIDTGQASITVGGANGMAWFVTSAGSGTGRQANPISLAGLSAINDGAGTNPNDNDTIFLFEGSHALTGLLQLRTNQKLFGQDVSGATLTELGAPAPQPGNAWPALDAGGGTVLISSSGVAIVLGSNNEIAGFTVGNATTAIAGNVVGALNVRDVVVATNGSGLSIAGGGAMTTAAPYTGFTSISTTGDNGAFQRGVSLFNLTGTLSLGGGDISGVSDESFLVSGGDADITYAGTITHTGAGHMITIGNTTGGSVTFTTEAANGLNHVSGGGSGVAIHGAAGNVTVNNADLNTGTGIQVTGEAVHLATGTYTFNNVTIDATAASGLVVQGQAPQYYVSAVIDLNNVDITNPIGNVVSIQGMNGGSIDFDAASAIVRSNGGPGILAGNNSGGAFTFNSSTLQLTTSTNIAVALVSNFGSTFNFSGGLDIDTTSGTGFHAVGGTCVISVSGGSRTINTASGRAVVMDSVLIGPAGVSFDSITVAAGPISADALRFNDVYGATFSGGHVTVGGIPPTGDGIEISWSGATFTFASATIDNTGGAGIRLVGENGVVTFTTVDIDGTTDAGIDISGNTNAVNVNGGTIGAGDDPAGSVVNLSAGGANVTIAAGLTKSTSNSLVSVAGRTGGIVDFSGALQCTSACGGISLVGNSSGSISFSGATKTLNTGISSGVFLLNNGGAAINFTGGNLVIDSTDGHGFQATGGGTVTVQGAGNTINAPKGTALEIANTNIGASHVTFQRVSAGDAIGSSMAGIILDTTGSAGGLRVTGTGTAGSGGTIQHKVGGDFSTTTGVGIYLNNTSDVQLDRMLLHDFDNYAILGNNVTGFTLANSTINAATVNGNLQVPDTGEGSVRFNNLMGTASITNSTITHGVWDNVAIVNNGNQAAALTFTATNSTFATTTTSSTGNDAVRIEIEDPIAGGPQAEAWITITGSTFAAARGELLDITAQRNAVAGTAANAAIVHADIIGNDFINTHPTVAAGRGGVILGGNGNATLNVDDNDFQGANGVAVLVAKGPTAGIINATANNNRIGASGVPLSGSATSDGLRVNGSGAGSLTASLTNNTIVQTDAMGIRAGTGNGNSFGNDGTLNLTVTGNVVAESGGGLWTDVGTGLSGDTTAACIDIGGATVLPPGNDFSASDPLEVDEIALNVLTGSTLRLPGYGGADSILAQITSYLQGRNVNGLSTAVDILNDGTITTTGSCTQPLMSSLGQPGPLHAPHALVAPAFVPAVIDVPSRWIADRLNDVRAAVRSIRTAPRPASMVRPVARPATAARSAGSWRAPALAESMSWVTSHLRTAMRTTVLMARRMPALLSATLEARSGETISQGLGTIPAGKSVTIMFDVTVDARTASYSVQGTATGGNFSAVLTDDPDVVGMNDATNTIGDLFDTTTTLDAEPTSPQFVSQEVELTATVTSEAGGDVPTGNVTFKETGVDITGCINISLDVDGKAVCSIPGNTFAAGAKSFTAHYAGDSLHDPSVNAPALSYTYDACTIDAVVTDGGDAGAGTLRDALGDACPGSTITFDTGTITGPITLTSGELVTSRDVTVQWTGAGLLEIRRHDSATHFRIVHVPGGRTVTLDQLQLTNGDLGLYGLSGRGGGVLNEGTLTIKNSEVSGNHVGGQGGGIANSAMTPGTTAALTLQNTTVSGNETAYLGGGIVNEADASSTASVTLQDSLIAGNFANDAGGIYNNGSNGTVTLTATNVTLSGNATGGGGAALLNSNGLVTITNGTITANTSNVFNFPFELTAGIQTFGGTATLNNTIVAGNTRNGVPDDFEGTVEVASAGNLIGNGEKLTGITHGSNGNLVGTAASPIDPKLGALANNGGPTETHALQGGSPAIDAGFAVVDPITSLPLATDQRGQPRPADSPNVVNAAGGDGSDIGAYEAPAPPAVPDLQAASDSGALDDDNVTNAATPTFDIGGVTPGALVELLVDGNVVTSDTAATTTIALTATALADGPHSVTARETGPAGTSPPSAALAMTIDTVAPSTPTIDLDAGSDSGSSDHDDRTNATTRVFTIGNTDLGSHLTLRRSGTLAFVTTGTGGTVQMDDTLVFVSNVLFEYKAAQFDTAGNVAESAPLYVTLDNTPPAVAITSSVGDRTNSPLIPATVTFSEDVTGFSDSGLVAGNGTISDFAGGGAVYTFNLTAAAEGAATVDIAAGVAADIAGNSNTAATQFVRAYDLTAPVGAIGPVSPDPRNISVDTIDITFDQNVSGLSTGDFMLTRDGGANLLTGSENLSVTPSGVYTLHDLGGLTGTPGSYTLTLVAAGSGVQDDAGNALVVNAADSWVMETTLPTVTINQAAGQPDPAANLTPINFTAVFSEPINPFFFTGADIDLSGSTALGTFVNITEIAPNDGTTFNVEFSNSTAGILTAQVAAGAVLDLAGNLSLASTSTDNTVTLLDCAAFTIAVTSTDDSGPGTLRQALADVCPGGTITFDLPGAGPHFISISSVINLTFDVTISGPANEQVYLDGGGASALLAVSPSVTARIDRLTFSHARGLGGPALLNQGSVSIFDSAFVVNNAIFDGGAISNSGVMGLANTTVAGNEAEGGGGGGVYNHDGAVLFLLNTTITRNQAGTDRGGGVLNTGTIYMENTILAGNTADQGGPDVLDDGGGVTNDLGHNLIGVDPKLGPLQNNGGPTPSIAPLPGSPAIDAGNSVIPPAVPLNYDQRGPGFGRIRDGADPDTDPAVDIGAIEADPAIEDISDKTTTEGTPITFTFHVGDATSPFEPFSVLSSERMLLPEENIVITQATPSSYTATLTPTAGKSGSTTVIFTARKTIGDATLMMSDSFELTVAPTANTPSINSPSMLEDQFTILFVTPNALDGAEVTHVKITTLSGGTLLMSNGSTPLPLDAFTTMADAAAGLIFKPTPNFFGTAFVGVRASIGASDAGLGGGEAVSQITIAPVADPPTITNALTTVNRQTTSGLVITRNPVDGNEVTHYLISNVTGGGLFQNDGVTPLTPGTFITVAQGAAGLKFTPATGSTATGKVPVRASLSNTASGLSSTATADVVVVGAFTDDPLVAGVTPIKLIHLLELRARVNAQRVRFGLSEATYSAKTAGVSLITAADLLEIRTALSQAYVAHLLPAPTFTDPGLPAGTVIKAVHFQELRDKIIALEGTP